MGVEVIEHDPDLFRLRVVDIDQVPAEADMQRYFDVTAPSVHQMVLTLEKNGFISRTPGRPRSIRLLLTRDNLPDLN